ncbi:MAG TPA: PLP-dependent aminotransferase family protein [Steroidobacteraceae bacterium]|jgi:2-aminoadipate transaminase
MSNTYSFSRTAQSVQGSAIRELLRHALTPGVISLAGGLPNAELFDVDGLRAATHAMFESNARVALQYGATEGQESLQTAIAALVRKRGINVHPSSVLVTTGSQQGLDLIARAFVDEGDVVGLQVPTYLAAVQAFDLRGARYLRLPWEMEWKGVSGMAHRHDGAGRPRMDGADRPKLAYVVSNFANPSGECLSLAERRALLRWAAANRVFVLEDDPYGELRFAGSPLPSMWELAQEIPGAPPWVGYASSLSKIVAPGLRIGWLILPEAVRETVARIKQALDLHTSSFSQEIAARYLASGELEGRLEIARPRYAVQCEALASAVQEEFGDELEFKKPEGGMFLWCRFREPIDTAELLPVAREHGVIFVPGSVFHPGGGDASTMRLSFSTVSPEALLEGVRRLSNAYSETMRLV